MVSEKQKNTMTDVGCAVFGVSMALTLLIFSLSVAVWVHWIF